MNQGLIDTAAKEVPDTDRRIYGVAVAQVIDNLDSSNQGRVQLHFPWLPGVEPWARVAVLMAGNDCGSYFIPQTGDEVLVAFVNGNIAAPCVIGCLWNGQDSPPSKSSQDAVNKRIIRTRLGHELIFDESEQTISITSSTGQKIVMGQETVEITTTQKTASVKLETSGKITLQADVSIDIKAPKISINGTNLEFKGSAATSINGGNLCQIEGATVKIN
ncbi:MAG: phage baseplate assembly protein V [Desulfobaccales bacterium]